MKSHAAKAKHECPEITSSFVVTLKLNKTDNGWSRWRGIGQ
jgi:hypothetical protein